MNQPKEGFWDAFFKWGAATYGVALSPLFARLFSGENAPFTSEYCLFVLVLGATGALEAAFVAQGSSLRRSFLIFGGGVAALYGGMGYVKVTAGATLPAGGFLWWFVGGLTVAYLAYKIPVLRDQCM